MGDHHDRVKFRSCFSATRGESDSGFIYKLYGFDYIRELELLREAGFRPLEVILAATLKGAEALGRASQIRCIELGKMADAIKLDRNNEPVRAGGVK